MIPGRAQTILTSMAEDQHDRVEAQVGRGCLPWFTMDMRYLVWFLATLGT